MPKEDETIGKKGSNFDPKTAKGNVMLFRYLNDMSLQKCKQKFEASAATLLKKNGRKKMPVQMEVNKTEPN